MSGLPCAQRATIGITGQEKAERRRPGSREAEPKEWCGNFLIVYFGVGQIPLLNFQSVGEVAHDLVGEDLFTELVEVRLVVEGVDQYIQTLLPGVGAKIVHSDVLAGSVYEGTRIQLSSFHG